MHHYHKTRRLFCVCPLFREFHDLGDVVKIKFPEYSKSCAILVYYLVQQAKTRKYRAPK